MEGAAEIWWIWILQGGKAAHQETSDDDGQRGDLVKPMEEKKPSLAKKRSFAQLDSAQKCAMNRWSEGREQARFVGMIDLNTQRNASWLSEEERAHGNKVEECLEVCVQ